MAKAIKNADRLIQRLNNIGKSDLSGAMTKALVLVHGDAKSNAPVAEVNGGTLRNSIMMDTKKKGNTIEGRVFTNVQYAAYVEFGTGQRGNGSYPYEPKDLKLTYHAEWPGQVAQPFMYPALNRHKKYINKLFKEAMHDQVVKQCKGGK